MCLVESQHLAVCNLYKNAIFHLSSLQGQPESSRHLLTALSVLFAVNVVLDFWLLPLSLV